MLDFELETMISQQLVSRGVTDQRVLSAYRAVPRRAFAPDYLESKAYADVELPIGLGQTIAPPYVSARMLQELAPPDGGRVLEIGTGSGFVTALLARLCKTVYTVEYLPELAARARKTLLQVLGIPNIQFHVGDGYYGWSDQAPFDAIIVNASALVVPEPLTGQLRSGGRLVMAVGGEEGVPQELHVIQRTDDEDELRVIPASVFGGHLPRLQGEAEEY
ncbi:MAG: protein-L-isoaspartate O-methyltransferase [Myxococcota bacterium]